MEKKHLFLSLLTAFLGSTIALFVAGISTAGFPFPLTILKYRLFSAALLFYFLTFLKKKNNQQLPWKILIFHGLIPTFLAMLLFFYSICIGTPPGLATFLFYLFPVSNMFFGKLFLNEVPDKRAWFSLAISTAGLFLMLVQKSDASAAGILTSFISGLLFGLGLLCSRYYMLHHLSIRTVNFYVFMIAALAAILADFCFLHFKSAGLNISGNISLNLPVVLNFSGLILFGTVAFFALISYISGKMENYLLSIILTLEPAMTTIFSVFLFDEKVTLIRFSGMFLIILGISALYDKK